MTTGEILDALEEGDDLNHDDPRSGGSGFGPDFDEVRPVWAGVPIGWVVRSTELAASDQPWIAVPRPDAPGAGGGWAHTLIGHCFASAQEGAEALRAVW